MSLGVSSRDVERYVPGTIASYKFSAKVIAIILLLSFGVGLVLQLIGQPLYAGMTVALGVYLVICSILFITVPLIVLDIFFD